MTPRQAELYAYLENRLRYSDVAPSHREIAEALGLRSTSSVHRLVTALERNGHIVRTPGGHRSIRLVTPDDRVRDAAKALIEAHDRGRLAQAVINDLRNAVGA